MKAKTRDSGMELLKVIAMLMVILIHCYLYGGYYNEAVAVGGVVREASTFMRIAFRPAVNIFLLITGFFMVKAPVNIEKSFSRTKSVYLRIFFYSLVFSAVFLLLGSEYCVPFANDTPYPIKTVVLNGLFPLTSQSWYYLTNYILLCLLAPFINIALQNITKKQYLKLLAVLTFLLCFWVNAISIYPFKLWVSNLFLTSISDGKSLFSFIYVYIIGGYVGLHVKKREKPDFRYLLFALAILCVNYLLHSNLPKTIGYTSISMNYSNPFVIGQGVFMLLFFKDLHFKNKFVNFLGSTTLGVYAIHEFRFIRPLIWKEWFNFKTIDCTNIFRNMIITVGVCFAIYLVSAVVDYLVQMLFHYGKKVKPLFIRSKAEKQ